MSAEELMDISCPECEGTGMSGRDPETNGRCWDCYGTGIGEPAPSSGLCADRAEHPGHLHESPSLGRFWCTGDPADREPGRSERRARADGTVYGIRPHLPVTADDLAKRERVMRATPLVPLDLFLSEGSSSSAPRSTSGSEPER